MKLRPIELAEAALLADVAVLFQIVYMYLPVPGIFLRVFIPIVFTVLVLRRGLYAGIMSTLVAVFIAGLITGPNLLDLVYLLLEGIGGMFLGFTMRRQVNPLVILLLGATGLGVATGFMTIAAVLLLGLPLSYLATQLARLYGTSLRVLAFIAQNAGPPMYAWWLHTGIVLLDPAAQFALKYWLALFFVVNWGIALGVNVVMYYLTNFFVRLLGYEVRPYPFVWVERLARRLIRRGLRMGLRRGWLRRRKGEV